MTDQEIVQRAVQKTMEKLGVEGLFSKDYPRNAELEMPEQIQKQLDAEDRRKRHRARPTWRSTAW